MKRNIRLSKVSEENNQIFFLHEVIRKNFAKISNRISFLSSRYNLSSFQVGLMLLSWYQQGIRDRCLPSIKVYVTINPSRISLHYENCREDYKRLLSWDTLETQLQIKLPHLSRISHVVSYDGDDKIEQFRRRLNALKG